MLYWTGTGTSCIYTSRLFNVVDIFVVIVVSARLNIRCYRCSFLDQCICNLLFFELADTFKFVYHVQLHLHLTFSGIWGYFLRKFYICISHFLWPADAPHQNSASSIPKNPLSQILLNIPRVHSLHGLSQYITYKKIDIRNSSEYGVSVGDT